jgi:folylpolyglutamate synthase
VAGTKGKGSTCAFTECILRQHGLKTGLYISPHLNNVRERIRINSQPLNENKFTEYASFVFESLGLRKQPNDAPRYLQFLTLVSFVAFIKERVDVAIYETHQGGEFDSTNIITEPMVTAITSLGRDHMHQLGPTLEDVAWHKAGIFKGGAAAFSVPQEPTLASVLEARAEKKGVNLQFVDVGDNIPKDVIMPEPRVQQLNFSLAWAICNAFIKKTGTNLLSPNNLKIALKSYSWPGRFQQISDGDVTWFLDGAHNEISLGVCAEWFASASAKLEPGSSIDRVLIFSHYSTHRDGLELLTALVNSLSNHTIYIRQALFTRCEYANNGKYVNPFVFLRLHSFRPTNSTS